MARLIKDNITLNEVLSFFDKTVFLKEYNDTEISITMLMYISLFLFLFSPFLAMIALVGTLFLYYIKLAYKMLRTKTACFKI